MYVQGYQTQQLIESMMRTMMVVMSLGMVAPMMLQVQGRSAHSRLVYHGTTVEKSQEILEVGLFPIEEVGQDFPCVWLSPSPFYAGTFGDVVLGVTLSAKDMPYVSRATPNNWRYQDVIPPAQLSLYATVEKIEDRDTPTPRVYLRLADGTLRARRSPGAG